jgi:Xaa-Pro aminopeptidase
MTLNGPDLQTHALRRELASEQLEGGLLFIPEVAEAVYAGDVTYRYRPDTNVRYLSGFEEPCALLLSAHDGPEDGFSLCVAPRNAQSETWTGRRAGLEGAREIYGANHAFPLDETFAALGRSLRHAQRFFFSMSRRPEINQKVLDLVETVNMERRKKGAAALAIEDPHEILGEMRLFKSDEEIALMRKAAQISSAAHLHVLEQARAGMHEYEIEALLEYEFRRAGCSAVAYGSIVAAGVNATVLHYTRNDEVLTDGGLLLIDAGGEFGGYCADITRTNPIGRSFTKGQAALYDIVLESQLAAIEAVKPESTIEQVHRAAVDVLCEGLVELGILKGSAAEAYESGSYKPYYMHNTSHWLGMEVHDVGRYRDDDEPRSLEPGMVLTVEPGLYIREDADVDECYRGVGIRIEDDLLVARGGHEVLTAAAPKNRHELEAIRAAALG